MLAYLHPVIGAAVLVLLGYVAILGLRLRRARRGRAVVAAQHAQLAPVVYTLVLVAWATGALSVYALRPDVESGSTFHFRVGSLIALLLTGSALTARWMRTNAELRDLHPWLGATATLLAAAQVVAGLQLLP